MKILLVEDDKDIAQTLKEELGKDYVVETALTGEEGEYLGQINEYHLIILDLMLPDITGIDICRKLRQNKITSPILMLTGQDSTEVKIQCLDCGADDYITKPFDFYELKARIRALLRRQNYLTSNLLIVDNLILDPVTKIVSRGGTPIYLRRKEFDLLEYLMRNRGKVISRNTILDHVWDSSYDSDNNTVDVHIKHVRDKIDKPYKKVLIKTIHGFGYKLEI